MSAIYDNWERLVAAALKKEELWQLFHADSVSPSISSGSSGFSFCRLSSSLDDVPFGFPSPGWSASTQKDDDLGTKNAEPTHSRKRDLKIQVPKLGIEARGFSNSPQTSQHHRLNVSPTPRSRASRDQTKQESYPLPLPPPAAIPNSPHVSPPNSAAKSPAAPLPSPESAQSRGRSWKKGKLIGRGPLGHVYLGFNSLLQEIALLSCINHPNIVQYYGSETVADNFYIYYEYVSGGSINMILQQYGSLGESAIRSYTRQILSGLAYLHSKSIAHRDIKGASLLLDSNGRVKLCNFGIEKHIADRSRRLWLSDSCNWMAPEVIRNADVPNLAVDIWSLGCTILEMATSRPPLSQYDRVVIMLKTASHEELPSIPNHLSAVCKDFLRHCLWWDPLHRASASQLLEHPFVNNSSPSRKQILVSTSSPHPVITNAVKSEGIDRARSLHPDDSGKGAFNSSKASKLNQYPSDIYTPRNMSAPVSPVVSPLLHPRSPQDLHRRMSPPPKSCPATASNPIVGGIVSTPHPFPNQSMLKQETLGNFPKKSPSINIPSYCDPNILRVMFRFS